MAYYDDYSKDELISLIDELNDTIEGLYNKLGSYENIKIDQENRLSKIEDIKDAVHDLYCIKCSGSEKLFDQVFSDFCNRLIGRSL
jgi:hypothetical protein